MFDMQGDIAETELQGSVLTNWTTSPTCFLTFIGNPRV